MLANWQSPILVVEDIDEDFATIQRIFQKTGVTNPIMRCIDGEDALDLLYQRGKYSNKTLRPAIILLDLNLPGTDGRDVLTQIKHDPQLRSIPVIVLTTSNNPNDIAYCYDQGSNSYVLKPVDLAEYTLALRALHNYWFNTTLLPGEVQP